MNRLFLSVHDKICSGVFRLHKGALGLLVLAALLILGAFMLLADRAQPQTLFGTWYSQEGDFTLRQRRDSCASMTSASPLSGRCPLSTPPPGTIPRALCWRRLDGRSAGRYFFEGELLYLEVDSQQKIFSRTPPAGMGV